MGKMGGLFLMLASTGGFCAALATCSSTATDDEKSSPRRSDITKSATDASDLGLAMAPEGWRVFLQSWSARETVEADPASIVTTIAPRTNGAAIRKQITSAADTVPPIPRDRASLVRELQRELRRVGCYDGRLNESWTAATRTAMKAFTNRVNASLPIDRPDHILLTLVRGHQGRACGIACPPRQSLTHEGRCVPTAILARANQKSLQRKTTLPGGEKQTTPVLASWSAVVTAPTTPENPGEGRMMLAGPLEKQGKTSAMAPVATAPMNPGRALPAPHRDSQRRSTFGPTYFKKLNSLGAN